MNKYEQHLSERIPTVRKIKPWGKLGEAYLIPYEYGHGDRGRIATDGGAVWWVDINGMTSRADADPDQTPFTIEDLDI